MGNSRQWVHFRIWDGGEWEDGEYEQPNGFAFFVFGFEITILGGGLKYFLSSSLFREDSPFWLIVFKGVETTNQHFFNL